MADSHGNGESFEAHGFGMGLRSTSRSSSTLDRLIIVAGFAALVWANLYGASKLVEVIQWMFKQNIAIQERALQVQETQTERIELLRQAQEKAVRELQLTRSVTRETTKGIEELTEVLVKPQPERPAVRQEQQREKSIGEVP